MRKILCTSLSIQYIRVHDSVCLGGLSQTGNFARWKSKEKVQTDLRRAVAILVKNDIDLIICEVDTKVYYGLNLQGTLYCKKDHLIKSSFNIDKQDF